VGPRCHRDGEESVVPNVFLDLRSTVELCGSAAPNLFFQSLSSAKHALSKPKRTRGATPVENKYVNNTHIGRNDEHVTIIHLSTKEQSNLSSCRPNIFGTKTTTPPARETIR
jgi:hypothetical protein